MDRKTFIRKTSAGIIIGIPAIGLLSCSGSDDGGTPTPRPDPVPGNGTSRNCLENGTNESISANHGHSLSVPKEDVQAAVAKSYTLSEGSGGGFAEHIHEVTISQSQFESLQDNEQITVISTSDEGHTHNVTVSCA